MTQAPLDDLTKLAIKFGSDKYGAHLYTPIYDELFSKMRNRPLRLLEIGVGGYGSSQAGGGSLRMWAEYFPNAYIVGLDINEKDFVLPERVSLFKGSQTDVAVLQKLHSMHGPFDVVIDDGSHDVLHVNTTFNYFYPIIASNGIYVVEDTQTAFSSLTNGNSTGSGSIFETAKNIGLQMHVLEGYKAECTKAQIIEFAKSTRSITVERNLIIFQRGDNTYPSNGRMDFSDPAVDSVYNTMEIESDRNPSSRNSISRVDLNIWAGRIDAAAQLAMRSAIAYPGDKALLSELSRMMIRANRPEEAAELEKMITKCS